MRGPIPWGSDLMVPSLATGGGDVAKNWPSFRPQGWVPVRPELPPRFALWALGERGLSSLWITRYEAEYLELSRPFSSQSEDGASDQRGLGSKADHQRETEPYPHR